MTALLEERPLAPDELESLRTIPTLPTDAQKAEIKSKLKNLTVNEFIEFAFKRGLIEMDVNKESPTFGQVKNMTRLDKETGKPGRIIKPRRSDLHHLVVHLCIYGVQRTAGLHRMLAVRLYGANTVGNKEVANVFDDREQRPLKIGSGRPHTYKREWQPCVSCGTHDGAAHGTNRNPSRFSAERFGYPSGSKLCLACYAREGRLARREASKARS